MQILIGHFGAQPFYLQYSHINTGHIRQFHKSPFHETGQIYKYPHGDRPTNPCGIPNLEKNLRGQALKDY